jgi:hypothetical protein
LLQVLQYLEDAGRPLPPNPAAPFWVSRADLIEADVLPKSLLTGEEPKLLLITDPDDRLLCGLPKDEQLHAFWRVLFQARVMEELERRATSGGLTAEKCRDKLTRFGAYVEREIRYVLGCEHLILPDADALSLYCVFTRVYLDLREFDRDRLGDVFPSLPEPDLVDQMLAEDVAVKPLKASSRPTGAAGVSVQRPPEVEWSTPSRLELPRDVPQETGALGAQAAEAEQRGNHVRAAIIYTQLAARAGGTERDRLRRRAQGTLAILLHALGEQFGWDGETRREWLQALTPVLAAASSGIWPRAARCLFELQTIHADLSREVFAIDLPEAIRTFGRKPIKRLLPHARPVLILMHLKKAQMQMLRAGMTMSAQLRADRLFHHQIVLLEEKIREEFTPIIVGVLSRAGLSPKTTVEEVGREKLVAELIDRVCERGYLRLGDVRDSIARNQLKMPDLDGLKEFVLGDALLRANQGLADDLDGVYRRGEFYLRWIQRFSAVFFGTRVGRLFTIYLAIPFGGSFLALVFAEEVHHIGGKVVAAISRSAPKPVAENRPATAATEQANPNRDKIQAHDVEWNSDTNDVEFYGPEVVTSDGVEITDGGELIWYDSQAGSALASQVFTPLSIQSQEEESDHPPMVDWEAIIGFGVFLLLMFHVPAFRRVVFLILSYAWRLIRGLLWDLPMAVWHSPTVRSLRNSLVFRFMKRNFWSPFLITILLFATLFVIGVSPWFLLRWGWVLWAGLTVAYNTRWGWLIQDRIAEAISDWWRIVRTNLIPGLIATFIDWFRMLGNWLERMLYAVDEWLRFRSGDSSGSFALKAVLGLVWFPIAYFFRFAFYLLVEPQINPVKHFPVVTVSHKVILAMVPQIAQWIGVSKATVIMFVAGIPGIFGFIAWELKENWRLYRANRSRRLQPVMIGSHGETMRGLLRPGFHSGTVPKLFRKLRNSRPSRTNRYHHDLEHVEEAVRRFTERELIAILDHCPEWGGAEVAIHELQFGCQRIAIEFSASGIGHDFFTISFENINGQIHAAVEQPGWTDKLTGQQRSALIAALRGWLDLASVVAVNGQPRQESQTPLGPGFEDLGRTMSWDDWVERWRANEAAAASPVPVS